MGKPERIGSIEIAQDMEFQRVSWRLQRVGWVVMLGITLAALIGVFGGGPLASAEAGDEKSGIRIAYQRFTRLNSRQTLDIEIAPAATQSDSTVRIWLDREWIESNEITNITPEPEATELDAESIIYTFKVGRSSTPLRARFHVETRVIGSVHGRAGLVGGPSRAFRQFSYP